ncbi:MAG: dihydropteroate synthase [Alphaproteobacteria bacterium]|nr:dihydropteroate synthase [Alphaproteobacteria bacterium]
MEKKQSKIFGVLNITPDSFSDGGKYFTPEKALSQVKNMIEGGVDVIDVGAESTRPDSDDTDVKKEIARLEILPEIKKLADEAGIPVSLDSRNAETIKQYIDSIDIINDVTGLRDENIQDLAIRYNKKVVLMHSLSVPVKKGEYVQCDDYIKHLDNWLQAKLNLLYKKGFRKDQIIFDPGIAFGTSPSQVIEILKGVEKLQNFGVEVLIGHARKSFLAQFGEEDASKRDPETHALTFYLARLGVDYMRIHDVWASKRIIKMAQEFA